MGISDPITRLLPSIQVISTQKDSLKTYGGLECASLTIPPTTIFSAEDNADVTTPGMIFDTGTLTVANLVVTDVLTTSGEHSLIDYDLATIDFVTFNSGIQLKDDADTFKKFIQGRRTVIITGSASDHALAVDLTKYQRQENVLAGLITFVNISDRDVLVTCYVDGHEPVPIATKQSATFVNVPSESTVVSNWLPI